MWRNMGMWRHISMRYVITSEQKERSSYYQSYMGHLDDIQTALKNEIEFMSI